MHNTGDNPRVRFHISVNITGLERGLKPYVLESTSPQLNYTRELPVKLSLFHPSDQALQAGYYPIEIKVTSGEYQGQVAADYQEFFVPSIYDVGVSFDNPAPCGEQQSGEDRDCVDC